MWKKETEHYHDVQGRNRRYIYPDHIEVKEAPSTPSYQSAVQAREVALDAIHVRVVDLFRAGIIVGGLTPQDNYQLKLYGGESPKHQDLMKVIDATNKKVGGKIKFGHNDLQKRWKMKQRSLYRHPIHIQRLLSI